MKKKIDFKKILTAVLICTLVLGILSSSFGVTVAALTSAAKTKKEESKTEEAATLEDSGTTHPDEAVGFEAPTESYPDLGNEANLLDNVLVISEEDSKAITSSVIGLETDNYYRYGDYTRIILEGRQHNELSQLSSDQIFYLQGGEADPMGGRFYSYINSYSYGNQTYLEVDEPYFEDVFNNLEMCLSDTLTEENFVQAYYANGVTSHFGNAEAEILQTANDGEVVRETLTPLTGDTDGGIVTTATELSTQKRDLIVTIEYEIDDEVDEKSKKKDDDGNPIDATFKITGQFGIRDLAAHVVCDMPSVGNLQELYFGVSGETFLDISFTGEMELKAEAEATKKNTFLASFEGLNEKRFPLAVFEFKGKTPVKISKAAFESKKDDLIPRLYLLLYCDWEGKISLSITTSFNYSHSFNNGLRLYKEGKPCLSFENYPYVKAYDAEAEGGTKWSSEIKLEADTDLTLLGGSLLLYIAGVNICEISAARLGVEAQCDMKIYADSTSPDVKILEQDDTNFYIRGYLKLLEVKAKLKADGKSFLKGLSIDVSFEFCLIDIDLFLLGVCPDKYKPKMPISSIPAPTEFDSVISLVFDVSGSMESSIATGQTKLEAAKEAAGTIVNAADTLSKNSDGVHGLGLVKFASEATTVSVPHIDYPFLLECIETMYDGGGTAIYAGIETGTAQLDPLKCPEKIIILMTDGQDSNASATRNAAQAAADKGITIYTIGFGSDVDETLLQEIASITGGEYRYASTDNVMSIIGSFLYAQQASTSTVLKEVEGTVAEGETTTPSYFDVKEEHAQLTVTTAWPGSFLDTILIDPEGNVVGEDYPGAVTDESKIPSTITVKDPMEGKWTLKIKGVECSYENEPFYTIVSVVKGEKPEEILSLNEGMSDLQAIASYCISIGSLTTLVSAILLFALKKKKAEAAPNGMN